MSRKNLLGFVGLALLSLVTVLATQYWIVRSAEAKGGKTRPAQAAGTASADYLPYVYSHSLTVVPRPAPGQIAFVVDFEAWCGKDKFPRLPRPEQAYRLKAEIYSPDDPDCQGAPIASRYSGAVEVRPGLYRERVPFAIAIQPNRRPYPVILRSESVGELRHKHLDGSVEVKPSEYGMKRFEMLVQ